MRTLKVLALASFLFVGFIAGASAAEPYLGVYLVDEMDSKNGAVVEDVKAGSPAAAAGLKKGDVITKFNGAMPLPESPKRTNTMPSRLSRRGSRRARPPSTRPLAPPLPHHPSLHPLTRSHARAPPPRSQRHPPLHALDDQTDARPRRLDPPAAQEVDVSEEEPQRPLDRPAAVAGAAAPAAQTLDG